MAPRMATVRRIIVFLSVAALMTACHFRIHAQSRPWPDTSATIAIFNDQLDTWSMNDAQFQFAATHYAGCQKITKADAEHLRMSSPNFLVLHYRLGQALGYRAPQGSCEPTGDWLQIIDGDNWVNEWPGDSTVQAEWFFQYAGSPRVFSCTDGHYLMELNDAAWREWWSAQVLQQIQDNEDDGLFADSYSIPNYFGGTNYNPNLPDVDAAFEAAWAAREHDFTNYIEGRFAGQYKWIPNIGALITSRDPSDYSNVDGCMIEGFAEWGGGNYLDPADWELQMNRVLPLTAAGKILIAQTYPNPDDVAERLFIVGTYLLVKGTHTYINMETSGMPEWFPEYAVDLGAATDALPTAISAFYYAPWSVYVRHFAKGMVLVNPTGTPSSATLPTSYNLVVPSGGGEVPADGSTPGSLAYNPATSVTVPAYGTAILLSQGGTCSLTCTATAPTSGEGGQQLAFTATATPSGCTGSPSFAWDFGDGASGTGASVNHAYASAGTYTWTMTATADTAMCTKTGSITITGGVNPPVVWGMTKMGSPFRVKVGGSNLEPGIRVFIDGAEWTQVTYKNDGKIFLAGGSALKAVIPRGTTHDYRFLNPDGGDVHFTWGW